MLGLPFSFLLAWTIPLSLWPKAALGLAAVRNTLSPLRCIAEQARLRILTDMSLQGRALKQAQRRLHQNQIVGLWVYFRAQSRRTPLPRVSLKGAEHLDKAKSRGSVLWVIPAVGSGLVTKKALFTKGIDFLHLSRSFHGISRSHFGRVALNWIIVRPEKRFSPKRLWMDQNQQRDALREASDELRKGGVVTVSMSRHGAKCTRVRVGKGTLDLATGAPNLAFTTGADLFPVVTRQIAATHYEVEILDPITFPKTSNRRQAVADVSCAFAEIVQNIFLEDPGAPVGSFLGVDQDTVARYTST